MFFWIVLIVIWLPFMIFYPVKVVGKENLPKKQKGQGVICSCNHYTMKDPIMMAIKLNRKIQFLSKKELFNNKLVGAFLKGLGSYPVDRENPDRKAVMFSLNVLKQGKTLGIFPEGTRNKNFETNASIDEVKSGAITFAAKTDSFIVPMAYTAPIKCCRRTTLVIGKPFKVVCEIEGRPN
ncbi:MAG: lysophospholipid acyltransferase family protein, partial [Clostridia bacterium]